MADNINDLVSVPETDTVSGEDYLILDQSKEINQIRLNDLCKFIGDLIPIANKVFPQALTLNAVLAEITNKLNLITARDIAYDGEIHQELSTVNGVLTYLLDTMSQYGEGVNPDNITWIASGDTPKHVTDDLGSSSASLDDIINYILNQYMYGSSTIEPSKIVADTTGWASEHADGVTTLKEQLDVIYNIAASIPVGAVSTLGYKIPVDDSSIITQFNKKETEINPVSE